MILKEEAAASSSEPPTTAKEPEPTEPSTPGPTILNATPKSSAILSGPKKKLRLQSPHELRKNLFESPGSTIPDRVLEEAVGCPLESGDAAAKVREALIREGSYEDAIDDCIDEDLAKAHSSGTAFVRFV